MNPPFPRFDAALNAALQRIKLAARQAAQRSVDSLGLAALASLSARERDALLAAQFELARKLVNFSHAFEETLDRHVARTLRPEAAKVSSPAMTDWESLSLVDDNEVEAQVRADRFGLAIQHECEWELRELDAYVASLLQLQCLNPERNPLRPEAVGLALIAGADAVSERPEVRKVLAAELGRTLISLMRGTYGEILDDLRRAGVQPLSLALRTSGRRGSDSLGASTGYGLSSDGRSTTVDTPMGPIGNAPGAGPGRTRSGSGNGWGSSSFSGSGATRTGSPAGTMGAVDAQLVSLIRRLAVLGNVSDSLHGTDSGLDGFGTGQDAGGGANGGAEWGQQPRRPVAPNLIVAHREELRQASTGTLDHMVIDVVGSLFDQILSDPKVPPQMARQIARLQLPVLRVALTDSTFFSSRRHPVRRFVNRIASLACAFDDFTQGPGQHFLKLVKELVQEIVGGDFDQMEVYEQKLSQLENFIAEQAQAEVREHGDPAQLLQRKEAELVLHQRYMQQLQFALAAIEMQDFLRDFLCQVWSQAIVRASERDPAGELAARFRRTARELVMSVQPKASPADRKNFLMQLPQLMKDLNDGLALIGWAENAKKDFFAKLLPAHAESLKGLAMRRLDYNLLVKELDRILAAPLPPGAGTNGEELSALDARCLPASALDVADAGLNEDEASKVGLVKETTFDWDGKVDIDLSAEPELTSVDINIDGLPPPEPAEPASGASLADHVQIGFAYQMHLDGQWQKVRLNYVSPARAFFVFTTGTKAQRTISLTQRMLKRMCETGRMRAFENAYLIERATARARKQLAALGPSALRH